MGKEKRERKVEMRENMVKNESFSEEDGDFIIKCQWGIFHHA